MIDTQTAVFTDKAVYEFSSDISLSSNNSILESLNKGQILFSGTGVFLKVTLFHYNINYPH